LKDEQVRLRELEAGLEDRQARIPGLREESGRISAALNESRESHQEARGRLASLQAAQEEALGKGTGAVAAWLGERDLGAALRLAERLDVQHGWERAVETVLGAHLESVCVDDVGAHAREVVDLEEGALGFVDVEPVIDSAPGHAAMAGRLLDKISTPGAVAALMNGVYAVDDVSDALALRARLGPGESAVTRAGVWVGPNWLRFAATPVDEAGVLCRELEIKRLAVLVDDTRARVERDSARLDAGMRELRTCEEAAAEQGRRVGEQHRRVAALRASLGAKQAEFDQARSRAAGIGGDLEELRGRSHEDHAALEAARQHLRDAFARLSEIDAQRDALNAERQSRQAGLDGVKERWQRVRDEHYEAGLRVESMGAKLSSLRSAGARGQERLARITSRRSALEQALQASQAPLREAKATLVEKLGLRRELERAHESSRTDVESAEAALRESERSRGLMENRVATERAGLEEVRMHTREAVIRRSTVVEQIAESGSTLEQALMSLPDEATEQDWQERLERMERRIARLGPINLAAIDEFGQQAQRKTYLDAQHADLVEALETLGQAIRKIDRETRARFKDTYEKVNAGLSDMFPRLFGGGTACLQMTGEDLLSTGITFLARPPGKRNTSIHLLSGGEKALCAIALVFSIFGLNPAPFCLMDEVDAPLDDANVGRFCDLVKSMTDRVQFMLVTHNKSTMEITEHLIGVTMNEPGISRLVAVDVEQAVELAAV